VLARLDEASAALGLGRRLQQRAQGHLSKEYALRAPCPKVLLSTSLVQGVPRPS
jgi:hypothetical protein